VAPANNAGQEHAAALAAAAAAAALAAATAAGSGGHRVDPAVEAVYSKAVDDGTQRGMQAACKRGVGEACVCVQGDGWWFLEGGCMNEGGEVGGDAWR